MKSDRDKTQILWRQVWGLSALLAAILISFMAYGYYQPKILRELGFGELAASLGIIQGLIGAAIEPLVGLVSDRVFRQVGSRLPIISVGVTLAGLIFVVIAFFLEGNIPEGLRWLVPVLMTLWVMAMIIFRGPAIALLRQFAPIEELPMANGILTLVLGLVGALSPPINLILNYIGDSLTFIIGAIGLVLGASVLFTSIPKHTLVLPDFDRYSFPTLQVLGLIFLVGLGTGIEINLMMGIIPPILQNQLGGGVVDLISSGILLVSGVSGIVLGELTVRLGSSLGMMVGLGAIAILMGVTLLNHSPILALGLIIAFGIGLGLILICQIPYSLGMMPPTLAGLGTGLYFGGMGGASALYSLFIKQSGGMTEVGAILGIAIAFFFTAPALVLSKRIAPLSSGL